MKRPGRLAVALLAVATWLPPMASAQPPLEPSRTVFKCVQDGRVTYTDAPCLGGERVDVTPTKGLDSLSGRARQGADVQREQRREQVAEALKPLTGMSSEALYRSARRQRLSPADQAACRALDRSLPEAERREREARTPAERAAAQRDVFAARRGWHDHGCD